MACLDYDMESPDLSHLTKEEQKQILAVMKRYQDEQQSEETMIKNLEKQFQDYKEHIKKAEDTKSLNDVCNHESKTNDAGQVCCLCHKTKIADGCGHTCSYCLKKFCSRCGGRVLVTSKKNERMFMWVCNLCRKQQEILTKTSDGCYQNDRYKSSLTLCLEPLNSDELKVTKISESASMAQLDMTVSRMFKLEPRRHSLRMKKGLSEPQLANCEKSSKSQCELSQKVINDESEVESTVENSEDISQKSEPQGKPTSGIRRSSAHSERRLYRQDQAVKHADGGSVQNKKQNDDDGILTSLITNVRSETNAEVQPNNEVTTSDNKENNVSESSIDKVSPESYAQGYPVKTLDLQKRRPDLNGCSIVVMKPESFVNPTNPVLDERSSKLIDNGIFDQRESIENSFIDFSNSSLSSITLNKNDTKPSLAFRKKFGAEVTSIQNKTNNTEESSKLDHNVMPQNPCTTYSYENTPSHLTPCRSPSSLLKQSHTTSNKAPCHGKDLQIADVPGAHIVHSSYLHGSPESVRSDYVREDVSSSESKLTNLSGSLLSTEFSENFDNNNLQISKSVSENHKVNAERQLGHVLHSGVHTRHVARKSRKYNQSSSVSDNEHSERYMSRNNHLATRKATEYSCQCNYRARNQPNHDGSAHVDLHLCHCSDDHKKLHYSDVCGFQGCSVVSNNTCKLRPCSRHAYDSDSSMSRCNRENLLESIDHQGACTGQGSVNTYQKHGDIPRLNSNPLQVSPNRKTYNKLKSVTDKVSWRKSSFSSTDDESSSDCSSCDDQRKDYAKAVFILLALTFLLATSAICICAVLYIKTSRIYLETAALQKSIKSGYYTSYVNHTSNDKKNFTGLDIFLDIAGVKILVSKRQSKSLIAISSPWHGNLNHATATMVRQYVCGCQQEQNEVKINQVGVCGGTTVSSDVDESDFHLQSNVNAIHYIGFEKQQSSWKSSQDGKYIIGNITLDKRVCTRAETNEKPTTIELGFKLQAAQPMVCGNLGTFIQEIKKGSLVDVVGHLKSGDEILSWNGYNFRNAKIEDVHAVVLASREETVVELVVLRPIIKNGPLPSLTEPSSSIFDSQDREDSLRFNHCTSCPTQLSAPGSGLFIRTHLAQAPFGKLQMRLWFDLALGYLYVQAIQAKGLTPRPDGFKRNPFIKMVLLPDQSESSERRSKMVKRTLHPFWNQSFRFGPIRKQDLESMALEVTLWDLDHSAQTNSHFLGKVLIDLGLVSLKNESQWFSLGPSRNDSYQQSASTHDSMKHNHSLYSSSISREHASSCLPHYISQCGYQSDSPLECVVSKQPISSVVKYQHPIVAEKHFRRLHGHKRFKECDADMCGCAPHLVTASSSLYFDGASSVSSSNSSLTEITKCRAQHFSGHRRVLPFAPSMDERLRKTEIMAKVAPNGHERRVETKVANIHSKHLLHSPDCSSPPIEPTIKSSTKRKDYINHIQNTVEHDSPDVISHSTRRRNNIDLHPLQQLHSDFNSKAQLQTKQHHRDEGNAVMPSRIGICADARKTPVSLTHLSKNSSELVSKRAGLSTDAYSHTKAKKESAQSSGRNTSRSRPGSGGEARVTNRKGNALGQKITSVVGLKNRSRSSSALEGNRQKNGSSPRTSEYGVHPEMTREGSRESASGSLPSIASEASSCVDKALQDFLGELGPGQVADRQVLASSSLGEIELSFHEKQGQKEVQVIRARRLVPKPGTKLLPAPYVKVYLLSGLQRVAKKKTKPTRRSLDPEFHQTIVFDPMDDGNRMQLIIYGDYGRMDQKAFMGIVQIRFDIIDISSNPRGWYKLFPIASFMDGASLGWTQPGSMTSLDSTSINFRS